MEKNARSRAGVNKDKKIPESCGMGGKPKKDPLSVKSYLKRKPQKKSGASTPAKSSSGMGGGRERSALRPPIDL